MEKKMKDFEESALQLIRKYQIPGTAIGLAIKGEKVYEKGFGFRNIRKNLPVTSDTIFGVASITKSFVCVAIMQLQEKGLLKVHDPVVEYLPDFHIKAEGIDKITIHHLMTHSAGIPPLPTLFYAGRRSRENDPAVADYPGLDFESGEDKESIETYEQLLEFIGEHNFELLGEPGSEFSYSNDSYALLGMIIDKVSGKPFEKYLKENIFDPAGMKHTYVLVEDLQEAENITTLYSKRKTDDGDSVYEAPIWWSSPAMLGAGSIKSCVNDMLRYADIYRTYGKVKDAQILTENSVKAMIEPYIECSPGKYYGYGLMITPNYYGGTLVEHGGNSKAIASQFVVIPERDVTGVTFTNLAGVPATTIMGGSLNVLEGRDFNDLPFQGDKYKYTKEELKQYEGKYVSN